MKKLYIVRHGESKWNEIGKVQGQMNIELTKKGINQAVELSKRLKNSCINHIYTSDLARALGTGKILSKELGIDLIVKEELREIDFGEWQGLTLEEIRKVDEKDYDKWRNTPHLLNRKNAESLINVQERAMKIINKLHKTHENEEILIISHGVVIKVILLSLLDLDLSNYRKISISNCGLSIVEFINKRPVIRCLNERVLLEDLI